MSTTPNHLLDWAETLLCNSMPMSHCSQEEWDRLIKVWRDEKHGVAKSANADLTAARADAKRLAEALRPLYNYLGEQVKEDGGCDHAVGICMCSVVGMLDKAHAALAAHEERKP